MMQSLHKSPMAAGVLAPGEKSNITARLRDRRFKDKIVSVFPPSANVSQRSMEKLVVAKLHRSAQVSWSTHILASPLFGVTIFFENSDRWKRFVASPSRENLGTANNSQDLSHPSKEIISRSSPQVGNQVEAHIRKNSLETSHIVFSNERWLSSSQKKDFTHVSDNLVSKSVIEDDPDRRESGEESSSAENEIQSDNDRGGVGENELIGGNGDDISSGRKRMGRSRRRKKKANAAGIATYDPQTNTVQLKGSATETSEINRQRQRKPRSSKRPSNEQEIQGAGVTSELNVGQGTGGALQFNFGSRSARKSLGVENAARFSRLLGLEDTDRNEQPSPNLATIDDAYREQFGDGEVLQRTVESYKADPNQETVADGPEVPLIRKSMKKSPAAEKASKTKVPDQSSESGKLEDVDAHAAISNEVEDINENSQTSELVESKVFVEVTDAVSEPAVEQVGVIIDQVTAQMNEQVQQVRINALVATESVASTASQVADSISSTATQVTESVASTAAKLSNSLNQILKDGIDSEDEFEESNGSDRPEFRGLSGLRNFIVVQEDQGILAKLRDSYFFMMKKPLPEFAMGMMAVPIALSLVFTLLYLPEFQGLAYDETVRDFLNPNTGMGGATGLEVSSMTIFQVFMFSLSLSTGLEPDLAPLSPYTLVVANINALFAQLTLAFLSAAVFARLSQPSEPVRCSRVALICAHNKRRGRSGEALDKVLLTRCVLAGPQPCELVNVKVDLTYRFNTVSSEGSFFRGSYPLKLVRSQIALLDQGMLVRHIIDESSPLYSRTPEMLHKDDAIFVLSVAGLERSSMQPIFHVQYYSVCDEQVIWNAEFEDMILLNKKNQRVVDHSKLSSWKPL